MSRGERATRLSKLDEAEAEGGPLSRPAVHLPKGRGEPGIMLAQEEEEEDERGREDIFVVASGRRK